MKLTLLSMPTIQRVVTAAAANPMSRNRVVNERNGQPVDADAEDQRDAGEQRTGR